MAKSGIHGFEIRRRAEQAVANSGGIQSMIASQAAYIAGNANAALGENAYRSRQVQGRFAKGCVVSVVLSNSKTGHVFDDAERRKSILESQI